MVRQLVCVATCRTRLTQSCQLLLHLPLCVFLTNAASLERAGRRRVGARRARGRGRRSRGRAWPQAGWGRTRRLALSIRDSAPSPAPQASPPSHSRLGCALRVALAPLGRRHPPCPKHRAGNPKPGVHAACTGFCGQCRARLSRTQLRSLKGLARFRMCCALTLQHALDGRELREYGARLLVHVAENER